MSYSKKQNNTDKSKFVYTPEFLPSALDEGYQKLNENGTYTYLVNCKLISSVEELESLKESFRNKIVAFDSETTGISYYSDYIVGFSLSLNKYSGIYVPIRHKIRNVEEKKVTKLDENGNIVYTKTGKESTVTVKEYTYDEEPLNLDAKKCLDILYGILVNAQFVLCHNAEFDMVMLKAEGYDVSKIKVFDTLVLAHLADPESQVKALKGKGGKPGCAEHYLGRYRADFKSTLGTEDNFQYVSPEDAYFYACCDTMDTYGLYEKLYPIVKQTQDSCKDIITLDGKKYNVIQKDQKLIKCWIDYYHNTEMLIDNEVAKKYKDKVSKEQKLLTEEIYEYFEKIFNLSPTSKEFKDIMVEFNIVTGALTDKNAPSYGSKGVKTFGRALRKLKSIINLQQDICFENSYLDIRANLVSLTLSKLIETYGKDYFKITLAANELRILDKNNNTLSKAEFIQLLQKMQELEEKKCDILKKIKRNSSLNKAINSYIDKLTQVTSCRIKYRIFGTRSGRLSSGNGSKSEKSRNNYYIGLNSQNFTKPHSDTWVATKSNSENSILGWDFELLSDVFIKQYPNMLTNKNSIEDSDERRAY